MNSCEMPARGTSTRIGSTPAARAWRLTTFCDGGAPAERFCAALDRRIGDSAAHRDRFLNRLADLQVKLDAARAAIEPEGRLPRRESEELGGHGHVARRHT